MCLPPSDKGDIAYESTGRSRQPEPVVETDDEDETPRVTFQEANLRQILEIPTALSCLEDPQDRRQLWYIRADFQDFRQQAHTLTAQVRNGVTLSEDENTRGLELRLSLQRQDRKQMVVKRILDAQDDDCTAEELSQIAQEHSVYSRKLALAQAHKDYYAAYHPDLTSVLPEMPALLDCHKDASTNKRSLLGSSLTQTGRRIRARMY